MDNNQPHPTRRHRNRAATAAIAAALAGLVTVQIVVCSATPSTGTLPAASCCEKSASIETAAVPAARVVSTSSDDDQTPTPDTTAEYVGGSAARLHTADGTPVPGDVFLLMATAGTNGAARLYDHTAYTHDNGIAADAHESNVAAHTVVETITGTDIDHLEFTTAPGGGPSAGITYTITYLNVISNGAFTGNLRIAATGRIGTHGYVDAINAINEKTAAAHLAGADVLFTPSTPTAEHLDAYGERHTGERFRARHTGNPLSEERRLDSYRSWGTDRPDGMDIIHVNHIADVAAYLCGTGSTYACHITNLLDGTTTEHTTNRTDADQPLHDSKPAGLH